MTDDETQQQDTGIGSPGERRREFLRAFTEQGWARPGVERPTARPHVTLIVTTVATLLSLLAGVAMQLIRPVQLESTAKTASPSPAPTTTYAAVAGWDCAPANDHGFTAAGRQSTWATIGRGAWSRNGCHGDYQAMPFTGSGNAATHASTAEWWFRPAKAMKRCRVLVLLPAADSTVYQPVHSATYSVVNGSGGAEMAQFTLDQTVHTQTWAPGGTYPVGSNGIAVRLSSAGKAPSARAGLVVAQVRVRCTA